MKLGLASVSGNAATGKAFDSLALSHNSKVVKELSVSRNVLGSTA